MTEHVQGKWSGPSTFRRIAKALLPPIVVTAVRSLMKRSTPGEWEYLGTSWSPVESEGWDDASIVQTQRASWRDFGAGVAEPNPMRHVPGSGNRPATDDDYRFHNTAMAFAYVLARAGRGRNRLTMLDWGGGLGQYALLARALLPDVAIDYSCRDLPRLAEAGRSLLPGDRYYDSDEELMGQTFDLVLASSSLQYSPEWRSTIATLAAATGRYLFLTRLPMVFDSASFVVLQRPHRYGYNTEYSGWFLNRDELLATASANRLLLVREFLIMEGHHAEGAPEDAESRGYLFESTREEPI